MNQQLQWLVVTDLDGSLLDEDYSFEAARSALERLRLLQVPLVLNSSKTVAEMIEIASDLETRAPLVAENGGVFAYYQTSQQSYEIQHLGLARTEIVRCAHALREAEDYQFSGFSDWAVADVCEHTGLTQLAAAKALDRHATEPIHWHDTPVRREAFEAALCSEGIRLLRGGRFLHLMGEVDKADGIAALRKHYLGFKIIAIGDSENDKAMLDAADIAVVIPHADGARIQSTAPQTFQASFPASKGWNEALNQILDQIS